MHHKTNCHEVQKKFNLTATTTCAVCMHTIIKREKRCVCLALSFIFQQNTSIRMPTKEPNARLEGK